MNQRPRRAGSWSGLGLDLVTLRLFKAAVEERSLVRAGEREHLALSAVSRRIAEMEARVGTSLLRRHDRGVEPTAAGEVLMRHLDVLFDLLERTALDLEAFAAGVRGYIRLHANLSAIAGSLPEALATFQVLHPEIEISLEERISTDILHAVQIGTADIGLVSGTLPDVGLQLVHWLNDRLMVVVPQAHPLALTDAPLRFSDIVTEPFVGMSAAMALQTLYRREAAILGETLRERVNVASFDGVRRMVEAGFGIGILPEAASAPFAQVMRIVVRPLDEPWAKRSLALCFRDRETLSTAGRLLITHLVGEDIFTS
jgi:DNA-binding transcriptional LysR family regulator|nr:LysR family transcriptional regulator [Acidisoma sp. S159]